MLFFSIAISGAIVLFFFGSAIVAIGRNSWEIDRGVYVRDNSTMNEIQEENEFAEWDARFKEGLKTPEEKKRVVIDSSNGDWLEDEAYRNRDITYLAAKEVVSRRGGTSGGGVM
jgi:hypothetical protein